ncbi:MAG: FAD-binding protein [Mesorhizobium sp.]|nr:MAG: FAD-binding protein [Mesorhizobium sp.]
MADDADVIIVGAGLAGLVAAAELVEAGKKIIVVDQEPEQSLGGQAFWSLGGIFLVGSPEQRRMRIRDSHDLALEDWLGTAAFDRAEDLWPRRWAEAYVGFAAGEKRSWLMQRGIKFFPVVGWAERGGGNAVGHGNSVPRFHVTWGTGPGVLEPFVQRVREAEKHGLIRFRFRHRVNELTRTGGVVDGVRGDMLAPSDVERGRKSHIMGTGFDYSWFILTQKIIQKEFALSGSEQNPDLTGKSWRQVLGRATSGVPGPVKAFMEKGEDFIVEPDLPALVARMNALVGGEPLLELRQVEREIRARDRQLDNPFSKDMQITALRGARAYLGDRLIRTARPHKMLDPANGPLIAVRLNILTRKTLGGLQTDLGSRVLDAEGQPIEGLYAVGEAAGFGGGGMHGYAALEGTFLGGCVFSGRSAGRAAARAVG